MLLQSLNLIKLPTITILYLEALWVFVATLYILSNIQLNSSLLTAVSLKFIYFCLNCFYISVFTFESGSVPHFFFSRCF